MNRKSDAPPCTCHRLCACGSQRSLAWLLFSESVAGSGNGLFLQILLLLCSQGHLLAWLHHFHFFSPSSYIQFGKHYAMTHRFVAPNAEGWNISAGGASDLFVSNIHENVIRGALILAFSQHFVWIIRYECCWRRRTLTATLTHKRSILFSIRNYVICITWICIESNLQILIGKWLEGMGQIRTVRWWQSKISDCAVRWVIYRAYRVWLLYEGSCWPCCSRSIISKMLMSRINAVLIDLHRFRLKLFPSDKSQLQLCSNCILSLKFIAYCTL